MSKKNRTVRNLDRSIATSITLAAAELIRVSNDRKAYEAAGLATRVAAYFVTGEIDGDMLGSVEPRAHDRAEGELRYAVEAAVEAANEAIGTHDEESAPGLALAVERFEALLELSLIALLSPPLPERTSKSDAREAVLQ